MKVTNNPALDAYQRMAVTPVGAPRAPSPVKAADKPTATVQDQQIAKVSISSEARQLAVGGSSAVSDPEKIQRLKAALDTNQLTFDSTQIAERMLGALS